MLYSLMIGQKEEPQIVTLPEPVRMMGVSQRTTPKSIFSDSQILGKRYQKIKTEGLVPNKKEPWGFVAISKDFRPDDSWEYLMGDVVTSFEDAPEGLTCFEIPASTYARFTFRPRWLAVWGLALGLFKRYIYTEWLPQSPYETAPALIGDFEYHDQRSLGKHPEIDLYISIGERKKKAR